MISNELVIRGMCVRMIFGDVCCICAAGLKGGLGLGRGGGCLGRRLGLGLWTRICFFCLFRIAVLGMVSIYYQAV